MIQGEVTVPYTPIGGSNMDYGIMPLAVTGSSNQVPDDEGGSTNLGFMVSWTLPGGINNVSNGNVHNGMAWGYILGRDVQNQQPYSDNDFKDYLMEKGYAFTDDFELENSALKDSLINFINDLVTSYFRRVQMNSGLEEGYDWNTMNIYYNTCMDW